MGISVVFSLIDLVRDTGECSIDLRGKISVITLPRAFHNIQFPWYVP